MNKLIYPIAAAAFVSSASLAFAADNASQNFIKDAIQGNLAEVAVGKLAQQKGNSDAVRSFGQMLATDHAEANEKAMGAASTLGVAPPTAPARKQQAVYDKLDKLSGEAFDRAFAKNMVDDHKKDIRTYEKEAKKSNDPAAGYANDALPTLKKHLEAAQSLERSNTAAR